MNDPVNPLPARRLSLGARIALAVGAFVFLSMVVLVFLAYTFVVNVVETPVAMMRQMHNDMGGMVNDSFLFAQRLAEDLNRTLRFTPRITVNGMVVVGESSPIMELATAEQDIVTEYNWTHSYAGSTKTLKVRGTFHVKAGFDLNQPFSIDVRPNDVHVQLPNPKILSVEQAHLDILEDQSGWWNSVSKEDRQQAIEQLDHKTREAVAQGPLLQDASKSIEEKIRDAVMRNSRPVYFDFGNVAPSEFRNPPMPPGAFPGGAVPPPGYPPPPMPPPPAGGSR